MVRQVWIAASLLTTAFAAPSAVSGSNQIASDPRRFSALLYVDQFVVLYFVGAQLFIPPSYRARLTSLIPSRICTTKPS